MRGFGLKGGDAYMMSRKATGNDWGGGSSNIMHLRHAAGEIFTLLSNSAWKPYELEESYLKGIMSDITFPLGDGQEIMKDLDRILLQEKVQGIKESNWLKRYKGTYVPPKRKAKEEEA